MPTLVLTSVALTLLLCGGYAGMILMCQIGILPAMRQLSLSAYADAWRAMDAYMDRLMPPYKGALLLVNAVSVIALLLEHNLPLAAATGVSLALSLVGLFLTVRLQLPLNARLKTLGAHADDQTLLTVREGTIQGFTVRFYLAALAFAVLCVGVLLWPVR